MSLPSKAHWCCLLGVLLGAGCNRPAENPAAEATPAATTPGAPAAAATPAAPQGAIVSEADLGPVLEEMTQALRKFSFEKKRLPASIDELVSAGYLGAKPTPPGSKRFAIDPKEARVVVK